MGKKLEDMNLMDAFFFSVTMSSKKHAIPIAERILAPVLQREVKVKSVSAEMAVFPHAPGKHGIRMDAYVEENNADVTGGTIYDLEPENKEQKKADLPKRARFDHSRIDSYTLASGMDYRELGKCFVIFFCSFDPFGEGRMMYTIRNHCVELPKMEYDDGAVTLFLYTRGTGGEPPKDLAQLLHYMQDSILANAVNDNLKDIQERVEDLKRDPEIKRMHMDWDMFIEEEREEAAEEANRRAEKAEAMAAEAILRADKAEAQASEASLRADKAEAQASEASLRADRYLALLRDHGIDLDTDV